MKRYVATALMFAYLVCMCFVVIFGWPKPFFVVGGTLMSVFAVWALGQTWTRWFRVG
jgi:hypothetical protein